MTQIVKPYGDTLNDGKIQLSFALPVSADAKGKEAARVLILSMGFDEAEITCLRDLGEGFTHFVAYASTNVGVDLDKIKVKVVETPVMDMEATEKYVEEHIGRELTVVGACIESDAHTVGIDAIMNMKGYNHRFGLERYSCFNAINMGAQVPSEDLLARARAEKADVILVSQVVTQKNIHIQNLTRLIELAEAEGLRDKMLFICGGPRISHELAIELGYDAGFGTGSYSTDVASYIAITLAQKQGN
ncbi:MAG: OAM dimerization domain-containing protein [Candidatus Cloacimonetes bacterium]|jgi:beta-lysine 5,6-aminomutase beta subunit|nr:cobalamin-dependent protein [Candidatus Cloacimonadota bacterium]MDY0337883.1 OAM dimerization domain-containing protein [Candidatus Cloacimonadaceae bacterium]MCK9335964.1 cobalamin-dependent protein [Candidatus Cloacimonadota bacterium]MDD2543602.1 OAM dimerization domain-containing protein [Candidatus Cloacimonadota bacterium]MDD3097792.1 OAM dimerization domain-containing protein [Candidatus Cloacimonadota bacterium]